MLVLEESIVVSNGGNEKTYLTVLVTAGLMLVVGTVMVVLKVSVVLFLRDVLE